MYPDPNVPRHGKSLYKPYIYPYNTWVFMGYYSQESLYKPYKYHGYTNVRGTPNCPLKMSGICDDPGSRMIFFRCIRCETGGT